MDQTGRRSGSAGLCIPDRQIAGLAGGHDQAPRARGSGTRRRHVHMISVDEAEKRIIAAFKPTAPETVPISEAAGRVLAADAIAKSDQPPAPVSSMDGYAVRAADVASVPSTLRIIGSSPAGRPYDGTVGAGDAVRIFTGGVVPDGADSIVIQEDAEIS